MSVTKEKERPLGARVKDRHRVMLRKLARKLKGSQEAMVQLAIEEKHDREFPKNHGQ